MESRFLITVAHTKSLRESFYRMQWKFLQRRFSHAFCITLLLLLVVWLGCSSVWMGFAAFAGLLLGRLTVYVGYRCYSRYQCCQLDVSVSYAFHEDSFIRSRLVSDTDVSVYCFEECCYYTSAEFLVTCEGMLYVYSRQWEHPWVCIPMQEFPDVCALLYYVLPKRITKYAIK